MSLISRKVPSREDKDNNLTVSHIWYYNNLGLDLTARSGIDNCSGMDSNCSGADFGPGLPRTPKPLQERII